MVLTKEMKEILNYLSNREDYVIFAGFAAFLHTGIKSSADIDIFVSNERDALLIFNFFKTLNWKNNGKSLFARDEGFYSLKKNETTFDICFSRKAYPLLFRDRILVSFVNNKLRVISAENMFLMRLSSLTHIGRLESKFKRDRKVIKILRKKINIKKLKKLILMIPDAFWKEGHF